MIDAKATPLFSLAYTSVRPGLMPLVVSTWTDRALNRDVWGLEWVLAVDEGDAASLAAANELAKKYDRFTVVVNTGPKNSVAGWNLAAAKTTGKIIIAVADDFVPPDGWDRLLISLKPESWPDEDRVIHINDGYVQTLCTLAILTRKRYERYGYLWYPKYESMFCDTEFSEVAQRDGVTIEAMHLLFEHKHPDCNKRPRDAADLKHASNTRWKTGEQLFNFRRSQGFPLDDGPKAVKVTGPALAPRVENKYCVYMQVTQDDLCLFEVCSRMKEEGATDIFWAEPNEYWSGEPIPGEKLDELDNVADRVRSIGINLRRKEFSPSENRLPGDSRITVETRIRNDSLRWIRDQGFKHILVVDGDELWKPGTFNMIRPHIEQGQTAIATYMVPVIGCPGWPVGEAVDTAVVYVGGTVIFKCCRSPLGRFVIVPSAQVIHFTGTRRTLPETIEKHKRSGHYDDPDYLFDLWLKDVLPNIRPGWDYLWPNGIRGLHMYQPKQIWKRVREWLPDEISAMPKTIHRYLGGIAASK